jgi:uncharacterized membrane protein
MDMIRNRRSTVSAAYVLLILLVLGVFFRFANIDRKLYWIDEVGTSFRLSGYTWAERKQGLVGDARILSVQDLEKYQYPSHEKSATDMVKGLALEESQNVPFYFVIARFWVQWLGNSVMVTRSFSAFISLLAFPCLYWLCKELFESPTVGWVAMALIAVSPVHVIYAQEARPYSLWIVTVLIASATMLRALRVKTKMSWVIYAVTVSLGLYTHLFFGLTAIGHGIYIAVTERCRWTKTAIGGYLALFGGLLTFVPWLCVLLLIPVNAETAGMSVTLNTKQTFLDSTIRWASIVSRGLVDLGASPTDPWAVKVALIPLILLVLLLIVYAIYFLCRRAPQRVWLFIILLIGSVALPLLLLDFGFGKRYGTTRYILPSTIGIQLAIAYLLATKTTVLSANIGRQRIWQTIGVLVLVAGVLSCAVSYPAEMWWSKYPREFGNYPQAARIINQANKPLFITYDAIHAQIMGHRLDPKVQLRVLNQADRIPEVGDGFSDVFLLRPAEPSKAELERAYRAGFKQVSGSLFWRSARSAQSIDFLK